MSSVQPAVLPRSRRVRIALVALLTLASGCVSLLATAPPATALTDCATLTSSIYQLVNPTTNANLLTPWSSEAAGARPSYGFTTDLGTPFSAAIVNQTGLSPVRRHYRAANNDFAWAVAGSPAASALISAGYADQGTNFYASASAIGSCSAPVLTMVRSDHRRYVLPDGEAALLGQGWVREGVAFYVKPAAATTPLDTSASTFSFAVVPDTQNEVLNTSDQRMPQRVSWLRANADKLKLTWVLHVGDLQNWDTADHIQFATNSSWLAPLGTAGIPYAAAIGNHDTAAVCPGGSACPGQNTNLALRNTTTWNTYYPPSRFGYEGVYQAGKSDNGYRTFSAGGLNWLVLTVELWPRTEVITWAKNVVATHPTHNVILLTHAFLEGNGALSTSQGGYGANSPATLWAALDDYPNVVMTFSGHVGGSAQNTLRGVDGHPNVAFLTCFHAPYLNPTRIISVDVANATIRTEIRANWDNSKPAGQQAVDYVYPYSSTVTGMRWVR
jgi:hypothetical protein